MFCTNCGSEIPDDSEFCPFCGASLSSTPADTGKAEENPDHTQVIPSPPQQPYYGAQNADSTAQQPYQQPYQQAPGNAAQRPPKKGHSTAIGILVGVLCGVAILFAIMFFMKIGPFAASDASKDAEAEAVTTATAEEDKEVDESDTSAESAESATSTTSSSTESSDSTDYILPDSSTRLYTEDELSGYSDWELYIARNEIYARHGRRFKNSDLQTYFDSKSWYNGTIDPDDFSDDMLNETERKNAVTIRSVEESRGSKYLN
jgi:hypothetical protein